MPTLDCTQIDFAPIFVPIPLGFNEEFKAMEKAFYKEASAHVKGRINKVLYTLGLRTLIGINVPVEQLKPLTWRDLADAKGVC